MECLFTGRWVVGLIPLDGPIELFLIPASTPNWYKTDCGMYCSGMVLIENPLLRIRKSGGCGFLFIISVVLNHMNVNKIC